MAKKELLSELKGMPLIDLLEIYVEARTGAYKVLGDELSVDTLQLIEELDNEIV